MRRKNDVKGEFERKRGRVLARERRRKMRRDGSEKENWSGRNENVDEGKWRRAGEDRVKERIRI